jgi:hypothetical protein
MHHPLPNSTALTRAATAAALGLFACGLLACAQPPPDDSVDASGFALGSEGGPCRAGGQCDDNRFCFTRPEGNRCLSTCAADADCLSMRCEQTAGIAVGVCAPPALPGLAGQPDGAACSFDQQCAGGVCLGTDRGFPGGHCTTPACARAGDCTGAAAACVSGRVDPATGQPVGTMCVQLCAGLDDCRAGYTCLQVQGGGYCTPDPSQQMPAPGPVQPAPAETPGAAPPGPGAPAPAPGDRPGSNPDTQPGTAPPEPASPPAEPEPEPEPEPPPPAARISQDCNARQVQRDVQPGVHLYEMDVDVPGDFDRFVLTPYSNEGSVYLSHLEGPGGRVDYVGDFEAGNVNAEFLGNIAPLLYPPAPSARWGRAGGRYTLAIYANAPPCWILAAGEAGLGRTLDINLYFAGGTAPTAAQAENDARVRELLDRSRTLFRRASIELGQVRLLDLPPDLANRYGVLRSETDIARLLSGLPEPGPTDDDKLSLNIVMLRSIVLDGGNVLGISAGIPGAAGVHGSPASGVVFAADGLDEPGQSALTLVHEAGHYLGLFHTTEQGGEYQDPLSDTPACPIGNWQSNNLDACPDLGNIMFPLAVIYDGQWSQQQAEVLRTNPLVK